MSTEQLEFSSTRRSSHPAGTNPFSFDTRGRLFVKGGRVHRQLAPGLATTFAQLQATGQLDRLFDAGLIRTWPVGDPTEGVVEHEFIPFITYPQEWTPEMLRQATITVFDIAILLNEIGLKLQDPHPWNVTFHYGKPVYYDLGSIFEGTQLHPRFVSDIFKGCYLPLWLRKHRVFAERFAQLAGAVMHSEHEWRLWKQPRIQWRRVFDRKLLGRLCIAFWRKVRRYESKPRELLRALRDEVATLEFPHLGTRWGGYEDPAESYGDVASYSPKARAVVKLLESLRPGRLLDLAANGGWFTGYAARLGHTALGVDIDPNAVDRALPRAREMKFDMALMNVCWPTPPQGAFLMYPSAYERFRADSVLMIALEHHLTLRQRISFEAIGSMARCYGAKNLIIEWVSKEDGTVQTALRTGRLEKVPAWYREDRFVDALSQHFPKVTRIASGAGYRGWTSIPDRTMFLFQR